jgi:hypothetical protein
VRLDGAEREAVGAHTGDPDVFLELIDFHIALSPIRRLPLQTR